MLSPHFLWWKIYTASLFYFCWKQIFILIKYIPIMTFLYFFFCSSRFFLLSSPSGFTHFLSFIRKQATKDNTKVERDIRRQKIVKHCGKDKTNKQKRAQVKAGGTTEMKSSPRSHIRNSRRQWMSWKPYYICKGPTGWKREEYILIYHYIYKEREIIQIMYK